MFQTNNNASFGLINIGLNNTPISADGPPVNRPPTFPEANAFRNNPSFATTINPPPVINNHFAYRIPCIRIRPPVIEQHISNGSQSNDGNPQGLPPPAPFSGNGELVRTSHHGQCLRGLEDDIDVRPADSKDLAKELSEKYERLPMAAKELIPKCC